MQTRYWPYMAGLVLCLTAALGCVTYMFSGGESPVLAFALCALALMGGQLLLGMYTSLQAGLAESNDRQLTLKIGKASAAQETTQRQADLALSQVQSMRTEALERGIAMTQSLDELKLSYESLAKSLLDNSVDLNSLDFDHGLARAENEFASPRGPAEPIAVPEPEHKLEVRPEDLILSLEPIVDLISGRTAHYRVHFALANPTDQSRALPPFQGGPRQPEIDLCAVQEALGLLQHLQRRDPQIRLFITLSPQSLGEPAIMLHLLEMLQAWPEPNASAGLVFELPHVTLAGLSPTALEGLADLARAGQPLALSNVSISGLDPASLQALNMRHVSLDANAIDLRFGMPEAYQHFAQLARIAQVQIMLANVSDAASLPQLRRLSRLGSGPVFAAPRRVRRNLAVASVGLAA